MQIDGKVFRGFRGAVLLSVLVLCYVLGSRAMAQEKGEGPMSLFMTYRCAPENRPAFRRHMEDAGVARFERWKREGAYADYIVLFSSLVNGGDTAPDMVVRLDFARYVDSAKWRTIERTTPAGLSPEALKLCTPVTSYLADLNYQGSPSAKRDLSKAVYLWIPYHLEKGISKGVYKKYFEGYVKPQNDGWLADGALSWWGVYFNQHNTGNPWDMVFLYEYSDLTGLARRDNVKESNRLRLANDPDWKKLSDNKQSYRWEDQVIIMDVILPKR
jgi:hypothetical protein